VQDSALDYTVVIFTNVGTVAQLYIHVFKPNQDQMSKLQTAFR
jgi:hypothetical protein